MKKIILIIILLLLTSLSYGEIASFEGGLVGDPTMSTGEYNYKEIIFITGEPIELTGIVKLPVIPTDKEKYSISYSYELRNIEKNIELSRSVTYQVTKDVKEAFSQTIYDYEISKLDEQIDVDGKEYILNSFLYNKSMIYDNTPAVDYFSGNQYLKRTYYIDGDPLENSGKVTTILTSNHDEGTMIGYNHLWGNAETYISKMTIETELPNPDYDNSDPNSKKSLEWWGTVDLKAAEQDFSSFKYQSTAPQSISFVGSYIRVDEMENIFQYTYDLPKIENGIVVEGERNIGEENLRNDQIVDGSSMVIPKLSDIGGHWSEENIFLLSSLEVIENDSPFYAPDQPLSRIEFAIMISNAIAKIEERSSYDVIRALRPGTTQMFHDIANDYEYYNYVAFVFNEGIMVGDRNYFYPDDKVTRAEVITILIRALGLVDRAPALPFETRYSDDSSIPNWSKPHIYMADEIDLINGYPDNTIKPYSYVTRAEGSAMIVNLIYHMKDNIRIDYREKLINRY